MMITSSLRIFLFLNFLFIYISVHKTDNIHFFLKRSPNEQFNCIVMNSTFSLPILLFSFQCQKNCFVKIFFDLIIKNSNFYKSRKERNKIIHSINGNMTSDHDIHREDEPNILDSIQIENMETFLSFLWSNTFDLIPTSGEGLLCGVFSVFYFLRKEKTDILLSNLISVSKNAMTDRDMLCLYYKFGGKKNSLFIKGKITGENNELIIINEIFYFLNDTKEDFIIFYNSDFHWEPLVFGKNKIFFQQCSFKITSLNVNFNILNMKPTYDLHALIEELNNQNIDNPTIIQLFTVLIENSISEESFLTDARSYIDNEPLIVSAFISWQQNENIRNFYKFRRNEIVNEIRAKERLEFEKEIQIDESIEKEIILSNAYNGTLALDFKELFEVAAVNKEIENLDIEEMKKNERIKQLEKEEKEKKEMERLNLLEAIKKLIKSDFARKILENTFNENRSFFKDSFVFVNSTIQKTKKMIENYSNHLHHEKNLNFQLKKLRQERTILLNREYMSEEFSREIRLSIISMNHNIRYINENKIMLSEENVRNAQLSLLEITKKEEQINIKKLFCNYRENLIVSNLNMINSKHKKLTEIIAKLKKKEENRLRVKIVECPIHDYVFIEECLSFSLESENEFLNRIHNNSILLINDRKRTILDSIKEKASTQNKINNDLIILSQSKINFQNKEEAMEKELIEKRKILDVRTNKYQSDREKVSRLQDVLDLQRKITEEKRKQDENYKKTKMEPLTELERNSKNIINSIERKISDIKKQIEIKEQLMINESIKLNIIQKDKLKLEFIRLENERKIKEQDHLKAVNRVVNNVNSKSNDDPKSETTGSSLQENPQNNTIIDIINNNPNQFYSTYYQIFPKNNYLVNYAQVHQAISNVIQLSTNPDSSARSNEYKKNGYYKFFVKIGLINKFPNFMSVLEQIISLKNPFLDSDKKQLCSFLGSNLASNRNVSVTSEVVQLKRETQTTSKSRVIKYDLNNLSIHIKFRNYLITKCKTPVIQGGILALIVCFAFEKISIDESIYENYENKMIDSHDFIRILRSNNFNSSVIIMYPEEKKVEHPRVRNIHKIVCSINHSSNFIFYFLIEDNKFIVLTDISSKNLENYEIITYPSNTRLLDIEDYDNKTTKEQKSLLTNIKSSVPSSILDKDGKIIDRSEKRDIEKKDKSRTIIPNTRIDKEPLLYLNSRTFLIKFRMKSKDFENLNKTCDVSETFFINNNVDILENLYNWYYQSINKGLKYNLVVIEDFVIQSNNTVKEKIIHVINNIRFKDTLVLGISDTLWTVSFPCDYPYSFRLFCDEKLLILTSHSLIQSHILIGEISDMIRDFTSETYNYIINTIVSSYDINDIDNIITTTKPFLKQINVDILEFEKILLRFIKVNNYKRIKNVFTIYNNSERTFPINLFSDDTNDIVHLKEVYSFFLTSDNYSASTFKLLKTYCSDFIKRKLTVNDICYEDYLTKKFTNILHKLNTIRNLRSEYFLVENSAVNLPFSFVLDYRYNIVNQSGDFESNIFFNISNYFSYLNTSQLNLKEIIDKESFIQFLLNTNLIVNFFIFSGSSVVINNHLVYNINNIDYYYDPMIMVNPMIMFMDGNIIRLLKIDNEKGTLTVTTDGNTTMLDIQSKYRNNRESNIKNFKLFADNYSDFFSIVELVPLYHYDGIKKRTIKNLGISNNLGNNILLKNLTDKFDNITSKSTYNPDVLKVQTTEEVLQELKESYYFWCEFKTILSDDNLKKLLCDGKLKSIEKYHNFDDLISKNYHSINFAYVSPYSSYKDDIDRQIIFIKSKLDEKEQEVSISRSLVDLKNSRNNILWNSIEKLDSYELINTNEIKWDDVKKDYEKHREKNKGNHSEYQKILKEKISVLNNRDRIIFMDTKKNIVRFKTPFELLISNFLKKRIKKRIDLISYLSLTVDLGNFCLFNEYISEALYNRDVDYCLSIITPYCVIIREYLIKTNTNLPLMNPDLDFSVMMNNFMTWSRLRHDVLSTIFMKTIAGSDFTMILDMNFNLYFRDMSRTPDQILFSKNKKRMLVIEFTYSHRYTKGLLSKGFNIENSKYYPEIYSIVDSGLVEEAYYLPIIFSKFMVDINNPDLVSMTKETKKQLELVDIEVSEELVTKTIINICRVITSYVEISDIIYKPNALFNWLISKNNSFKLQTMSFYQCVEYNSEMVDWFWADNRIVADFYHLIFGKYMRNKTEEEKQNIIIEMAVNVNYLQRIDLESENEFGPNPQHMVSLLRKAIISFGPKDTSMVSGTFKTEHAFLKNYQRVFNSDIRRSNFYSFTSYLSETYNLISQSVDCIPYINNEINVERLYTRNIVRRPRDDVHKYYVKKTQFTDLALGKDIILEYKSLSEYLNLTDVFLTQIDEEVRKYEKMIVKKISERIILINKDFNKQFNMEIQQIIENFEELIFNFIDFPDAEMLSFREIFMNNITEILIKDETILESFDKYYTHMRRVLIMKGIIKEDIGYKEKLKLQYHTPEFKYYIEESNKTQLELFLLKDKDDNKDHLNLSEDKDVFEKDKNVIYSNLGPKAKSIIDEQIKEDEKERNRKIDESNYKFYLDYIKGEIEREQKEKEFEEKNLSLIEIVREVNKSIVFFSPFRDFQNEEIIPLTDWYEETENDPDVDDPRIFSMDIIKGQKVLLSLESIIYLNLEELSSYCNLYSYSRNIYQAIYYHTILMEKMKKVRFSEDMIRICNNLKKNIIYLESNMDSSNLLIKIKDDKDMDSYLKDINKQNILNLYTIKMLSGSNRKRKRYSKFTLYFSVPLLIENIIFLEPNISEISRKEMFENLELKNYIKNENYITVSNFNYILFFSTFIGGIDPTDKIYIEVTSFRLIIVTRNDINDMDKIIFNISTKDYNDFVNIDPIYLKEYEYAYKKMDVNVKQQEIYTCNDIKNFTLQPLGAFYQRFEIWRRNNNHITPGKTQLIKFTCNLKYTDNLSEVPSSRRSTYLTLISKGNEIKFSDFFVGSFNDNRDNRFYSEIDRINNKYDNYNLEKLGSMNLHPNSFRKEDFFEKNIDFDEFIIDYKRVQNLLSRSKTYKRIDINQQISEVIINCQEKRNKKSTFKKETRVARSKQPFKISKEIKEQYWIKHYQSLSSNEDKTSLKYEDFFCENKEPNLGFMDDKQREFFTLFMNKNIEFCYKLSSINKSIIHEAYRLNIKKDRVLCSKERMFDLGYMIVGSKRMKAQNNEVEYMLFTSNIPSLGIDNVFQHKIDDKEIYFTNVLSSKYGVLAHRSNIFNDIFMICYLLFIRGNSIKELRNFFFMMYDLMYTCSFQCKSMFSIFKYSNITSLSEYSKIQNLYTKYIGNLLFDRPIYYFFARQIIRDINNNIMETNKIVNDQNPRLNFTFFSLTSKTLEGMIEFSVFYNFCYKDTTNIVHDLLSFLRTIKSNHNYILSKDVENGGLIFDLLEGQKDKFFIKESLLHSLDMFIKEFDQNKNILSFFSSQDFVKDFRKELIIDFESSFINMRKSMSIEDIKQTKTTNLENIKVFIENHMTMDIFSIENLIKKIIEESENMDIASAVVSKKSQPESSREIYELNLRAKCLAWIIQKVFLLYNKRCKREMVVESQANKLEIIRESTKMILKTTDPDEKVMYMNGDMGKWSGRDIFDKFIVMVDFMYQKGLMSLEIFNITKFCLVKLRNFKVIFPKDKHQEFSELKDYNRKGESFFQTENLWCQGIFHNISSFMHQLEQIFRQNLFIYHVKYTIDNLREDDVEVFIKVNDEKVENSGDFVKKLKSYVLTKEKWFQLVHSDDKNEVIKLHLFFIEDFVSYSTLTPRLFALETSETKDSYSYACSEIVGTQNIKGKIFDNGIKSLAQIYSSFEDVSFIDNYKYILNRSCSYLLKSNDIFGSHFIESFYRKKLLNSLSFKNDIYSKLNLNTGGRFNSILTSYIKFGNFSDYLRSYQEYKKYDIINSFIFKNKINFRKFKNKEFYSNIEKFCTSENISFSKHFKLDIEVPKDEYLANLECSLSGKKKEMLIQNNHMKILRFENYSKSKRYSWEDINSIVTKLTETYLSKDKSNVKFDKTNDDKENLKKLYQLLRSEKDKNVKDQIKIKINEIKQKNLHTFTELLNEKRIFLSKESVDMIRDNWHNFDSTLKINLQNIIFRESSIPDETITLNKENVSDYNFFNSHNFSYELENPISCYDTNRRTIFMMMISDKRIKTMSVGLYFLLISENYKNIFSSESCRVDIKRIVEEFNYINRILRIKDMSDAISKANSIRSFIDLYRVTKILAYTNVMNIKHFSKSLRNVAITTKDLKDIDEKHQQLTHIKNTHYDDIIILSPPNDIIELIQEKINLFLLRQDFDLIKMINEDLRDRNYSIESVLKNCSDMPVNIIISNIRGSLQKIGVKKLKSNKLNNVINYTLVYEKRKFDDNIEHTLMIKIFKKGNNVIDILIRFDMNTYLFNFQENDKLNYISKLKESYKHVNMSVKLMNKTDFDEVNAFFNLNQELENHMIMINESADKNIMNINSFYNIEKNTINLIEKENLFYIKGKISERMIEVRLFPYKNVKFYDDITDKNSILEIDYYLKYMKLIHRTEYSHELEPNIFSIKMDDSFFRKDYMLKFYLSVITFFVGRTVNLNDFRLSNSLSRKKIIEIDIENEIPVINTLISTVSYRSKFSIIVGIPSLLMNYLIDHTRNIIRQILDVVVFLDKRKILLKINTIKIENKIYITLESLMDTLTGIISSESSSEFSTESSLSEKVKEIVNILSVQIKKSLLEENNLLSKVDQYNSEFRKTNKVANKKTKIIKRIVREPDLERSVLINEKNVPSFKVNYKKFEEFFFSKNCFILSVIMYQIHLRCSNPLFYRLSKVFKIVFENSMGNSKVWNTFVKNDENLENLGRSLEIFLSHISIQKIQFIINKLYLEFTCPELYETKDDITELIKNINTFILPKMMTIEDKFRKFLKSFIKFSCEIGIDKNFVDDYRLSQF